MSVPTSLYHKLTCVSATPVPVVEAFLVAACHVATLQSQRRGKFPHPFAIVVPVYADVCVDEYKDGQSPVNTSSKSKSNKQNEYVKTWGHRAGST